MSHDAFVVLDRIDLATLQLLVTGGGALLKWWCTLHAAATVGHNFATSVAKTTGPELSEGIVGAFKFLVVGGLLHLITFDLIAHPLAEACHATWLVKRVGKGSAGQGGD